MKTFCLFFSLVLFGVNAGADITGRQVMEKVQNRPKPDTMTAQVEMVLIDGKSRARTHVLRKLEKGFGRDRFRVLLFDQPNNVKNVGFLTHDYRDEQEDEQWIYLPALKKTKRIARENQSGKFMGSDFNYSDMTTLNLDDYKFRLLQTVEIDALSCWAVESLPVNEAVAKKTGYRKSIVFVRQDNAVRVRGIYWTEDGKYVKYLEVPDLKEIDGLWIPATIRMTTKKNDVVQHQTIFSQSAIELGAEISDERFSPESLTLQN